MPEPFPTNYIFLSITKKTYRMRGRVAAPATTKFIISFRCPTPKEHNTPCLCTTTETAPEIVLKQCWGKLVRIFLKQVGKIVAIDAVCRYRAVVEEKHVWNFECNYDFWNSDKCCSQPFLSMCMCNKALEDSLNHLRFKPRDGYAHDKQDIWSYFGDIARDKGHVKITMLYYLDIWMANSLNFWTLQKLHVM